MVTDMDIGFLEQADHMKPLLVKLYDAHGSYRCYEDSAAKAKLSAVISDLLEISVSEREKDLVADILLALIQQAEVQLRQSVAKKVASMDNVSSRIVLNLAYDEIEVAECVLRESPILEALDLMYIIQSKTPGHWRAVASRAGLPESIIDELSMLDDKKTHQVLASNDSITLSEFSLDNLYKSASVSDGVASAFINRSDVPKKLIKKLYSAVGNQMKAQIEGLYADIYLPVAQAVDEAVSELTFEETVVNPFLPSKSMLAAEEARLQVRTERESQIKPVLLQEMLYELRLKSYKLFMAKFSIFMGVSPEESLEILEQEYGHGLAILSRAHGIDRSVFIKIFLLTEAVRATGTVMKGVTLNRALAYYDRLSPDLARALYTKNFGSCGLKH